MGAGSSNYYVNLDGKNDTLFKVTKEFVDWSTGRAHHYTARVLRTWVVVAIFLLIVVLMAVTCAMAYNIDINNIKGSNKSRAEIVVPISEKWAEESKGDIVLSVERVVTDAFGNFDHKFQDDEVYARYTVNYGYYITWQRGNNVYHLTIAEDQLRQSVDGTGISRIKFCMDFTRLLNDDNQFTGDLNNTETVAQRCMTEVWVTNVEVRLKS